ncbi:MAG: hypothetical protein JNM80_06795 [Phycisphaerae bacterium]|nr:hypothetical protein [Phycisphaerae bacterium]
MRVLHVLDATARMPRRPGPAGWDAEHALAACSLAASIPHVEHHVLILGGDWAADLARRLPTLLKRDPSAIPSPARVVRIAPPARLAWLSRRASARGGLLPHYDLVHAWDQGSSALARRWWPAARHVSWVGDDPPAIVRSRDPARRASLRDRWGIGSRTRAVLVLGPAPDAMRLSFVLGVAERVGGPIAGVLPTDAPEYHRAAAFHRLAQSRSPILVSPRPRSELLEACDLGLIDCSARSLRTADPRAFRAWIAEAHAAGLPVVCPAALADATLYPPAAAGLITTNTATLHVGSTLAVATALDLAALSDRVRAHAAGLALGAGLLASLRQAWGLSEAPIAAAEVA